MNWWQRAVFMALGDLKITPHFKLSEFNCKDGTPYPVEWVKSKLVPLCKALEVLRSALGNATITITSGYRTTNYNKTVGGARNSKHMEGIACDLKVDGHSAKAVYTKLRELIIAKKIPAGGIGLYKSWVHYDQRGKYVVWTG